MYGEERRVNRLHSKHKQKMNRQKRQNAVEANYWWAPPSNRFTLGSSTSVTRPLHIIFKLSTENFVCLFAIRI